MSTQRKRLGSMEAQAALRREREFESEFKRHSEGEKEFFRIYGYWPENASELPKRIAFTVGGIRTIVVAGKPRSDAMNGDEAAVLVGPLEPRDELKD